MKSGENGVSIDFLIENLKASDQVVRLHAATVLGAMGEDARPAVPALIAILRDARNIHDRKLAALTLGEIGPAAAAALPALFAAVDDEDEGLAEMAEWALEEVDALDEQGAA
jgi:HEAT repeat protein